MGQQTSCLCGARWSEEDLEWAKWYQNRAQAKHSGEGGGHLQHRDADTVLAELRALAAKDDEAEDEGEEGAQSKPKPAPPTSTQEETRAAEKKWKEAVTAFKK